MTQIAWAHINYALFQKICLLQNQMDLLDEINPVW